MGQKNVKFQINKLLENEWVVSVDMLINIQVVLFLKI